LASEDAVLPSPHPYRSAASRAAIASHNRGDTYQVERVVAESFLLGWSVLRLLLSAARGFDIDGALACVLVFVVVLELASSLHDARRARIRAEDRNLQTTHSTMEPVR
jgi:hypothetical protein